MCTAAHLGPSNKSAIDFYSSIQHLAHYLHHAASKKLLPATNERIAHLSDRRDVITLHLSSVCGMNNLVCCRYEFANILMTNNYLLKVPGNLCVCILYFIYIYIYIYIHI